MSIRDQCLIQQSVKTHGVPLQVLDEQGNFKEANFAQLRMNAFGQVDDASGAAAEDKSRAVSGAAASMSAPGDGGGRGGRGRLLDEPLRPLLLCCAAPLLAAY